MNLSGSRLFSIGGCTEGCIEGIKNVFTSVSKEQKFQVI